MNTKSLTAENPARCEYERIDADKRHYCCDRRAVCVWQATEDIQVNLCSSCKRWIETLESLGHKS